LGTGGVEGGTRFLADRMLGRLARYLRILGYDVAYPAPCPDASLIAQARREGRVLLTRDREIAARAASFPGHPAIVALRSQSVLAQVEQLVDEGWLDRVREPRCPACNGSLGTVSRVEARHLVPPYTFATQLDFLHCASCNLVLWEGSHWDLFQLRAGGILARPR
jgi:uncharacterized protein with PIN domain